MTSTHHIRTSILEKLVNPLQSYCWRDINKRITTKDITKRLKEDKELQYQVWDDSESNPIDSRKKHIEQIAWLVINGNWSDYPIDIDVGVPSIAEPSWIVQDGNHRLAAAIYILKIQKQDLTIHCDVSGSLRHARELGFQETKRVLSNEPKIS